MIIAYELQDSLYLNLTNRCNCACTFCIRNHRDGIAQGQNLWLKHEPTGAEVRAALEPLDLGRYREIVFCGYGEPTKALEVLLETCEYLKARAPQIPLRLNTNGLADLEHGRAVAPLLAGKLDAVSISLNAPDPVRYQAVTRPRFGEAAYPAMLDFAAACRDAGIAVQFTVVDLLPTEEIAASRQVAEGVGVPLRVRSELRDQGDSAAG